MPEPELSLVPLLCSSSGVSVDAGAYKGEWTRAMAEHSKSVHAFEPVPKLCRDLARRRFVKGKNILVHEAALSDRNGTETLYIPRFMSRFNQPYSLYAMSSAAGSSDAYLGRHCPEYLGDERLSVDAVTLDSLGLENVAFMKIDVEGYEERVLRGARETVERWRPHILVEIEDRHNPGGRGRIGEWLGDLGYSGYFLRGGGVSPFGEFDAEEMQRKPLERILHRATPDIPGYVNNFLFFHRSKDMAETIRERLPALLI